MDIGLALLDPVEVSGFGSNMQTRAGATICIVILMSEVRIIRPFNNRVVL